MPDGGEIEKTLSRFQRLFRCMLSVEFLQFAGLPPIFYWADNFIFNLGWGNAG